MKVAMATVPKAKGARAESVEKRVDEVEKAEEVMREVQEVLVAAVREEGGKVVEVTEAG